MEYRINPELQAELPPQRPEERAELKAKIAAEGCKRDALTVARVAGDLLLVDGHNTLAICGELGVEPPEPRVLLEAFANLAGAKAWMWRNALAHRNLTDEQWAYGVGMEYLAEKHALGDISRTTAAPQSATVAHCEKQGENAKNATADRIAANHGISPRTVHNNAAFAEAVNHVAETQGEEVKAAILSGAADVTRREVVNAAKADAPVLCPRCARNARTGQPPVRGCHDCKALRKPKPAEQEQSDDSTRQAGDDMVDAEGEEVPVQALPAFEAARDMEAWCRKIDAAVREVEALAKGPGGRLIRLDALRQQLKDAKGNVWANRPTHVCPYCHGKDPKCGPCKGEGWTSKTIWVSAPGNNEKAKGA